MRWIVFGVVLLLNGEAFAQTSSPWVSTREGKEEAPKRAALLFDLATRAQKNEDYVAAAQSYEQADELVPHPVTLRSAIAARFGAKDYSRAAALALTVQVRYPSDTPLVEFAARVLAETAPRLELLQVYCATDCVVAIDGSPLSKEQTRKLSVYVTPGEHTLLAQFERGTSAPQTFTSKAGATRTLTLETQPVVVTKQPSPMVEKKPREASPQSSLLRSEVVFWVAAGLTATSAAATLWSGIDTAKHPGTKRIRSECAKDDTSCPLYQEGLANQRRTNYLLGSTVALGLGTVAIAAFVTDWKSKPKPYHAATPDRLSLRRDSLDIKFDVGMPSRTELSVALRGHF